MTKKKIMRKKEMKCPSCKNRIKKKSKFCPWCGCNISKEKRYIRQRRVRKLAAVIAIAAGIFGITFSIQETESISESEESNTNQVPAIREYSNGDYIYSSSEESVRYDEDNHIIYYDELLIAYLTENLSLEDREILAESVEGELVGNMSGCMNIIEFKVKHAEYSDLEKKAEILMKDSKVFYADVEMPMMGSVSVADQNPWESDTDTHSDKNHDGNESKPSGNDWWAEQIGAYTAWNYIDEDVVHISDTKIGVIDVGVDETHEEFQEDANSKIEFLEEFSKNSPADHGTHVTGIIVAENNSVGIRGIADKSKILFANFADEELLSTGKFIEVTKQMIENDVRVINNSWNEYWLDQEKYEEQLWKAGSFAEKFRDKMNVGIFDRFHYFDGLYEDYKNMMMLTARKESYQVMGMMTELLLNKKDKILFVESAGNGYNNGDEGHLSSMAGYYCSVTRENYEALNRNGTLSRWGYNYETFKNHIMIVGATEREKDKNKLTEFSNYGQCVDIVAPGKEIFSTVTTRDDDGNNLYDGKKYASMQGTSMSAPMVSGSAALLWAVDPTLSAEEVKKVLINTAGEAERFSKKDEREKYPLLNIGAAMKWIVDERCKEEFRKVVEREEQKYGSYTPQTMGNVEYASGVCYLELRDVDNDGIDELFLVYNTNQKNEYSSLSMDAYQYELWKYENGQANLLETDGLYYSNGGFPSICWTEYQNRTYLVTNYQNVMSYWFHGFRDDGSFGVTDILLWEYADSTTDIYINGQNVSVDEWNRQRATRMENTTFVNLFYTENMHVSQMRGEYDMVGRVKENLQN